MEPYATENMPLEWQHMQNNDPKYSARLVKTQLQDQKKNIL